ncbi:MAG: BON domain-containing protein [Chloroflexi bacterium]|nr:BON domain-containing protein [Chloroflexota bacterium]
MSLTRNPRISSHEFSRCDERREMIVLGKDLSLTQKLDTVIRQSIYTALWKDEVLRATDYDEVDVHVKNGTVHLNGHILNTASQNRIKNAIQAIPGVLRIANDLVLDDELTLEVSALLGTLEKACGCNFFTGVSHGVVVLNGKVNSVQVRTSAEQYASSHPKVRGVINYLYIPGVELGRQDHRLVQPSIGKEFSFRDGISGIVRQVVINPDNRRVVAMLLQCHFSTPQPTPALPKKNGDKKAEQMLVIPVSVIGYLTKRSGSLTIQSTEYTKYQVFDTALFTAPIKDWVPPYPYCIDDVLFMVDPPQVDDTIEDAPILASAAITEAQELSEELLVNDSLGG